MESCREKEGREGGREGDKRREIVREVYLLLTLLGRLEQERIFVKGESETYENLDLVNSKAGRERDGESRECEFTLADSFSAVLASARSLYCAGSALIRSLASRGVDDE